MRLTRALFLACAPLVAFTGAAVAQPTYKLEVRPEQKPLATIKLGGGKVARTELSEDPGFRLQFHFKKDGKTLARVDARAEPSAALPSLAPGNYTVVLELFHPKYKGGKDPKGQYQAVSNELGYRVEAGTPPRVVPVEVPKKVEKPKKK